MKFREIYEVDYIIIKIDDSLLRHLNLNEGCWQQSSESGYSYRINPARPSQNQQRHIHIANTKHIRSKKEQVAWNIDGSKHDKKSFNTEFYGLEAAKRIARKALGLSTNLKLEKVTQFDNELFLIEENEVNFQNIFFLKLHTS